MTTPSGASGPNHTPTSRSAAPAPILRAIIWHAARGELPGELLSSLSKRIGRMIVCTDAYSALAEACLIERLRRHDLANGSPAPAGGILVLVQPAHLLNVPEVAEAMGSYAPSIALWSYDRSANPKLRAVVEGEMLSLAAKPPAAPSPRPAAQGRPVVVTRPISPIAPRPLNGHPPAPERPAPATPQQQRPARSPTLLTEDELAMLLTPDPQPPTSPIARIPRVPGGGNGTGNKGGRPA